MWFGKKAAEDAVKGIGGWIDEQQLTPEEQIKYKMVLLEKMAPFKIVQRIIVSIVFGHWILWGLNMMAAIWATQAWPNLTAVSMLTEYAALEMVYMPTIAAATLYLGGGLKGFFGAKK